MATEHPPAPDPPGSQAQVLGGLRVVEIGRYVAAPIFADLGAVAGQAVDEFDRRLSVRGDAVSRHRRGHGGDSLVHWHWDDGV